MKTIPLILTPLILVGTLVYGFPPTAPIPVIDLTELQQVIEEVNQLRSMYDQMKQQLAVAKEEVKTMTGTYGMGALLDSATDMDVRHWSADTWNHALMDLAGGNEQRFEYLKKQYIDQHVITDPNIFAQSHNPDQTAAYKEGINLNATIAAMAQDEYEKVNQYLNQIDTLTKEIDSSDNLNTKSSLDLNARLLSQIAYLMTETIKMQTVQLNLAAANQTQQLRDLGASSR